ncbi:transposase [Paenibacillus thiaminolyticus]
MKRIKRHVWAEYVEEADHPRQTEENKRMYAERKETIERVFAAMIHKKMATWLWKTIAHLIISTSYLKYGQRT